MSHRKPARRNSRFEPPSGHIPYPQYDRGYGPWHESVRPTPKRAFRHQMSGAGRSSSLQAPIDVPEHWEVGDWIISRLNGLYGRQIEELVWVDTNDIVPTELEDGHLFADRRHYLKTYIDWLREGHQPPPVTLIQTDSGDLRLTDGHRRYLAARALGVPLLATVSYAVPTGQLDTQGLPIKTGLTFEIALQDAVLLGFDVPARLKKGLREVEQKKESLRNRRRLLEAHPDRR